MSLLELDEEIARIQRAMKRLRNLGDVAACERRLTVLRARRAALAGGEVS